jgi:hypothetical protein
MRARGHLQGSPALFAVALALCGLPAASAGETSYCVTCQGPNQTYLCRVTGEEVSQSDAVKLYCVVRTAKEGGHASCGARNGGAGCNGIEKVYSYDGPGIPEGLAEDPRVKKFVGRIEKDQKAFDKKDKPKSLVEITGQALSASRRGWRNMRASIGGHDEANQSSAPSSPAPSHSAAQEPLPPMPDGTPSLPSSAMPAGTAAPPPEHKRGVGSFARNTYRCVRSLFRRCGSEAEARIPNWFSSWWRATRGQAFALARSGLQSSRGQPRCGGQEPPDCRGAPRG